jgi:hypothetical protein
VNRSLSTGCSRASRPAMRERTVPAGLPREVMSALAAGGTGDACPADAGRSPTPAQIAGVRRLFDEIGLDACASTRYAAKPAA